MAKRLHLCHPAPPRGDALQFWPWEGFFRASPLSTKTKILTALCFLGSSTYIGCCCMEVFLLGFFVEGKEIKKRREKNTAILIFFLHHVCTLQEATGSTCSWASQADAPHLVYREQVQGEEPQKVRDWRDNRLTKNSARGWRWKQGRTAVNRYNIMKGVWGRLIKIW